MSKYKILLADDHKIIRDGIRALTEDMDNIEIVGEAKDGEEVLKKVPVLQPDLVILDISMPELDGLHCAKGLKAKYPEVKILILTMMDEKQYIRTLLELGVNGYLLKSGGMDELKTALRDIFEGKNYYSPEVTEIIAGLDKKGSQTLDLSPRELEVLELIVKEYTNQEIANTLFISQRTVDAHKRNLLAKTGSKNTAGLVVLALKNKMVRIH